MKLFLTSQASKVVSNIANNLKIEKGSKLAFINTATEPIQNEDLTWLQDDKQAFIMQGFDVQEYTITGKTPAVLKSDLSKYKHIYVSGGYTDHLLNESYISGFNTLVRELVDSGVIYIGSSAGSIITGPSVPIYLKDPEKYPKMENKPAFGLVNFTVIPHWGDENFKERYLNERLLEIYNHHVNPHIILTDYQYVVVENNSFKIVDVDF